MTQYELEGLWLKSELPSVLFPFGTRVRAITGEQAGRHGRVIALLSIDPDPVYVVEEDAGSSWLARQPELERIQP